MLTTDMPEWLTVLLTEASAAVHGRGNLNALTAAIREVPEPYLEFAGLRWALSSFDDRAPTAEAINAARDQIGDPAPRLSLTPRSENPHELATAAPEPPLANTHYGSPEHAATEALNQYAGCVDGYVSDFAASVAGAVIKGLRERGFTVSRGPRCECGWTGVSNHMHDMRMGRANAD